jgi:epoxyqueuosine reductase
MSADTLSADAVKDKARQLGASLVGIASAERLEGLAHPPSRVLHGVRSVVVLARRFVYGAALLQDGTARTGHYTMEIGLTHLEEAALDLMFFLEDHGHPALSLPASANRSKQEDMAAKGPMSLTHAGVAAGLGTLGLNGMLLTPRFGPRVILCAVLTLAPFEPDEPLGEALCRGEECGRCLLACPGDAIGQWELDVESCRPYSSPYDYPYFKEHVAGVITAPSAEEQWKRAASTDSLMFWQSLLRGVGIVTGCTRCADVCPVGDDYERFLADDLEDIPEETPEKRDLLAELQGRAAAGERGDGYARMQPWIGAPGPGPTQG